MLLWRFRRLAEILDFEWSQIEGRIDLPDNLVMRTGAGATAHANRFEGIGIDPSDAEDAWFRLSLLIYGDGGDTGFIEIGYFSKCHRTKNDIGLIVSFQMHISINGRRVRNKERLRSRRNQVNEKQLFGVFVRAIGILVFMTGLQVFWLTSAQWLFPRPFGDNFFLDLVAPSMIYGLLAMVLGAAMVRWPQWVVHLAWLEKLPTINPPAPDDDIRAIDE